MRAAYVVALSDPASIHAICEEYRAAATLDLEQDKEDRLSGRRIGCPLLLLWSAGSALDDVVGRPMAGGHFFPEQNAAETAAQLLEFF